MRKKPKPKTITCPECETVTNVSMRSRTCGKNECARKYKYKTILKFKRRGQIKYQLEKLFPKTLESNT